MTAAPHPHSRHPASAAQIEPALMATRTKKPAKNRKVIPCDARASFLKKYETGTFEKKTFRADLITAEDFNFAVRVNNGCGATTIIGSTWKEFTRVYQLEVGMEVSFTINKPGVETTVKSSHPPIIPPLADSLDTTDGTKLNWRMIDHVVKHIDNLNTVLNHHKGRPSDGRCVPLVHTLNWTNCVKKHLKIIVRVDPEDMSSSGDITLVCHPNTMVESSYTISHDDGRLCVNGWKEFISKIPSLKIEDKVLFLLYIGNSGTFLFVSYVPTLPA